MIYILYSIQDNEFMNLYKTMCAYDKLAFDFCVLLTSDALVSTGLYKLGYTYVNIGT